MVKPIYECDPNNNKKCSKTGCYWYGGPCHLTGNKRYERKPKVKKEKKDDKS